MNELRPHLPTSEDHKGVMDAIFRLQDTYKLKSSSLARGVIDGVPNSKHSLRVEDIFDLGKHAFDKKDFPLAVQWLTAARDVSNQKQNQKQNQTQEGGDDKQKGDVLDYLAFALSGLYYVKVCTANFDEFSGVFFCGKGLKEESLSADIF